jgi:hypothetical protein
MKWEVVCIDWATRPNSVVETFEGPAAERKAKMYAEALDALALRCYARRVVELPVLPEPVDDRSWELGA